MQSFQESSQIVGKHRSKINALQTPSEATLEYAKTLTMHALGPGEIAEKEWAAAGLALPNMGIIRSYRLERVRDQPVVDVELRFVRELVQQLPRLGELQRVVVLDQLQRGLGQSFWYGAQ